MTDKTKKITNLLIVFIVDYIGVVLSIGLFSLILPSIYLATLIGPTLFQIAFLYYLFKRTNIPIIKEPIHITKKKCPMYYLLCIGILLALIGHIHFLILGSSPTGQEQAEINSDRIYIAISSILVAPITEELFYRKWMITYLEKAKVKPIFVLLITTFLFFIVHTGILHGSFRFDTLIVGAAKYYIYVKYRNIKYCIFAHFVNNLSAVTINILNTYF